jgi:HprK-related kinase A
LQSPIAFLGQAMHLLYADFPLADSTEFADFHVRVDRPSNFRRWYRPQVLFWFDDQIPFKPLPFSHAATMFEWCMNWCIETQANQYLIIHAAIIERYGSAMILAAPPGSGKSTLTAALISRGWRLLSDETTLIDPKNGRAVPIARPISLKNESIDLIRNFVAGAVVGPVVPDTLKGRVAHLKPPADSVRRVAETALAQWVIFPKYEPGADALLTPYPKANALLRLADNAFNYCQHGVIGFELLSELIDRCGCFEFTYSKLEDAVAVFDALNPAGTNPDCGRNDDFQRKPGPARAM